MAPRNFRRFPVLEGNLEGQKKKM